jgi:hypothetical protein
MKGGSGTDGYDDRIGRTPHLRDQFRSPPTGWLVPGRLIPIRNRALGSRNRGMRRGSMAYQTTGSTQGIFCCQHSGASTRKGFCRDLGVTGTGSTQAVRADRRSWVTTWDDTPNRRFISLINWLHTWLIGGFRPVGGSSLNPSQAPALMPFEPNRSPSAGRRPKDFRDRSIDGPPRRRGGQ